LEFVGAFEVHADFAPAGDVAQGGSEEGFREITCQGDNPTLSEMTTSAAAAKNALGRIVTAYDEAGIVITTGYTLDGQPTTTSRQVLATDTFLSLLPTGTTTAWTNTSYVVDWQPPGHPLNAQNLTARADTLLDSTSTYVATDSDPACSFGLPGRRRDQALLNATPPHGRPTVGSNEVRSLRSNVSWP
jgi:hypothetical protein